VLKDYEKVMPPLFQVCS